MGRTACTESQCLYNGDLYLFLYFLLTMTDIFAFQTIDLSSWITLYFTIKVLLLMYCVCTRVYFTSLYFHLTTTDNIAFQTIDLSSWITLYFTRKVLLLMYCVCTRVYFTFLYFHLTTTDNIAFQTIYLSSWITLYFTRKVLLLIYCVYFSPLTINSEPVTVYNMKWSLLESIECGVETLNFNFSCYDVT